MKTSVRSYKLPERNSLTVYRSERDTNLGCRD